MRIFFIMFHRLYAKLDQLGKGTILLDGKPLYTRSMQINTAVNEATTITVELFVSSVEVEIKPIIDDTPLDSAPIKD